LIRLPITLKPQSQPIAYVRERQSAYGGSHRKEEIYRKEEIFREKLSIDEIFGFFCALGKRWNKHE